MCVCVCVCVYVCIYSFWSEAYSICECLNPMTMTTCVFFSHYYFSFCLSYFFFYLQNNNKTSHARTQIHNIKPFFLLER